MLSGDVTYFCEYGLGVSRGWRRMTFQTSFYGHWKVRRLQYKHREAKFNGLILFRLQNSMTDFFMKNGVQTVH